MNGRVEGEASCAVCRCAFSALTRRTRNGACMLCIVDVFDIPWLQLLDDERVENLGDEWCFRRHCDGDERSSVLI